MSMVECNKTNCRNNYEGECLEVTLARLKISEHGTCCNYLPSERGALNNVRDRLSHLHKELEKEILEVEDETERKLIQYQINTLEIVFHVIDDVGRN